MASERRIERLQSQIIRQCTQILRRDLNDPRIGGVTISRVELSKDLRYCTIFVELVGTDTEKRTTMRGLQSARPVIQGKLGEHLDLKFVPQFRFEIDKYRENAQKMDALFEQIQKERVERENQNLADPCQNDMK